MGLINLVAGWLKPWKPAAAPSAPTPATAAVQIPDTARAVTPGMPASPPTFIAPNPPVITVTRAGSGVTKLDAEGRKLIEMFEQLRLRPYQDGDGYWTVGWGHALRNASGQMFKDSASVADAMARKFGAQVITAAQADATLEEDIAQFEGFVAKAAAPATQTQFNAMVSFCFNCGDGNFDTSSVKRLHNIGQRIFAPFDITILALRSKLKKPPSDLPQAFAAWSESDHQWTLGLFRRRVCEVMHYRGDAVQTAFDAVEAFTA